MGIGFQLLERAGELIRHAVGILLLAWRRMLWAMFIGGLAGIVLVEIVAAIVTHQVPPGIPAQVAALVFGVALAYAAGLTVLADELLRGAIDTVRLLEGDVKAGARAATIIAEREVGELRLGLSRRQAAGSASRTGTPGPRQSGGGASDALETSAETLDAIAATDEFTSTAPRPRVNARPVRADQLPRIPWAYEQRPDDSTSAETAETAETTPSLAVPDAAPYVAPLPPLPLKSTPEPDPKLEPPTESAEAVQPTGAPASRAPFIVTLAPQATSAQAATPDSNHTETPSPEARVVPVVSQPRATGDAQPADSAVAPSWSADPRGVWPRISQAPVGNTLAEPAEWTDPATGDSSAPSDIPPDPTGEAPTE